ncbi:hypothetical protein ScPMuIL_001848 [Solemya velum]
MGPSRDTSGYPVRENGYIYSGREKGHMYPARENGYMYPVRENGYGYPAGGTGYTYPFREDGFTSSAKTSKMSGERPSNSSDERKPSCFKRLSNIITTGLETIFYRIGKLIGLHPWITILLAVGVVGLFALGFLRFKESTDQYKLWVPDGADVLSQKEWVDTHFPAKRRFITVIMTNDDILKPESIRAMKDFYDKTINLSTPTGNNLSTLCFRSGNACQVTGLLELWKFNDTIIDALSDSDIISQINSVTTSPMYLSDYQIRNVLGKYTESSGEITAARATTMTWILKGDADLLAESEELESKFIEFIQEAQDGIKETFVYASRTFKDEGSGSIQNDIKLLSIGYVIVITFVVIVLGRFNMVEQRIGLSLCGIMCIGLSILFSIGLGSAAGYEYGPIHSILPFLMLGIGVDDMFVIVGCLNNLSPQEQGLHIPEKIGRTLRHAGVSVTVTSLTDIVAFGIGATTVLPALTSFCVYASLGITALFLLQTTLFVACLTLDLERSSTNRDAILCCYKHKNYKSNDCSQRDFERSFFKKFFAPFLMKFPVKVVVIITALGLLGANIYGVINLKEESDPSWFFPSDSYALKYNKAKAQYFPEDGYPSAVYCGDINYLENKVKLQEMYQGLVNHGNTYSGSVDSPFQSFDKWLNTTTDPNVTDLLNQDKVPSTVEHYNTLMGRFTSQEPSGRRYSSFVNIKMPEVTISSSKITFQHKDEDSVREDIKAMDSFRDLVKTVGLPCFVFGQRYTSLETNKIIQIELYRNLGLAAAAVFIVTLILIAHLWTSVLVFTCVILTLVDVMGCMYFWGLTIDTVSSVILILAIGLAVDYSAHIGHTFMTITGKRQERTISTLTDIAPPVFNGGFSTFLAFILLATSESYVFITFFKIFFLVVLFGLFHGLMYLPVLLSWFGPQPYLSAERRAEDVEHLHPGHPIETKHGHENHVFHLQNDWKSALSVPDTHISSNRGPLPPIPAADYDHHLFGHHHHGNHHGHHHEHHHHKHKPYHRDELHRHFPHSDERVPEYSNQYYAERDSYRDPYKNASNSHDGDFDNILDGVEIYRGSRRH